MGLGFATNALEYWVPAFAGTTAAWLVPSILEHAGVPLSRKRTERFIARFGKTKPTRRFGKTKPNVPGLAKRNQTLLVCRRALRLADLTQDFGGVLAEPWGGAWRCDRLAADHNRRSDSGNLAVLGGVARERKLHAAMNDLRIGKYLIEVVDRTG